MAEYYAMVFEDGDLVLKHYGVKGQKKGYRRYQNEDGSLTPEGYEHYGINPQTGKVANPEEALKKLQKDTDSFHDEAYEPYAKVRDKKGILHKKLISKTWNEYLKDAKAIRDGRNKVEEIILSGDEDFKAFKNAKDKKEIIKNSIPEKYRKDGFVEIDDMTDVEMYKASKYLKNLDIDEDKLKKGMMSHVGHWVTEWEEEGHPGTVDAVNKAPLRVRVYGGYNDGEPALEVELNDDDPKVAEAFGYHWIHWPITQDKDGKHRAHSAGMMFEG